LILDDGRLRHGGLYLFLEPVRDCRTQRLRLVMFDQSFDLVDGLSCLFYNEIIVILGDLVCVGLATKGSHVWLMQDES
jgi:hypothetical protein